MHPGRWGDGVREDFAFDFALRMSLLRAMSSRRSHREFLARHPALREALWWSIPALLAALGVRVALLSYLPLAQWTPDSMSFFEFAWKAHASGEWYLNEKRRYLYPIVLYAVEFLPGATLRWVAWLQHLAGILCVVPLAYLVRHCFHAWRWVVVPVTLAYALFPTLLWYEHTMLSDPMFCHATLLACAGWVGWRSRPAETWRWWWFCAPFAVAILTRPAGRFFLPGVVLALICTRAWLHLRWPHWAALVAAMALNLSLGKDKQVAYLFYRCAFPLTRLETPYLAEYKTEVRDEVLAVRSDPDRAYVRDAWLDDLIKRPAEMTGKPHWQALADRDEEKARVYKGLAMEALRAAPLEYFGLSLRRLVASLDVRPSFAWMFSVQYSKSEFRAQFERLAGKKELLRARIFGWGRRGPAPSLDECLREIAPDGETVAMRALQRWAGQWSRAVHFVAPSGAADRGLPISAFRPAGLSWLLAVGLCGCALRPWRETVGCLALMAMGYLVGVFMIGGANPRFAAAAWPVLLLLLALPVDALARAWVGRVERRGKRSASDIAPAAP